jgi:hypothetical protein
VEGRRTKDAVANASVDASDETISKSAASTKNVIDRLLRLPRRASERVDGRLPTVYSVDAVYRLRPSTPSSGPKGRQFTPQRRGCACPAPLAPPACRRARSFRGRHALECAGTAPSCHRPVIGPQGRQGSPRVDQRLVLARRPCASRGVQIAICESERMSTSSPGRTSSRAPVSASGRPR